MNSKELVLRALRNEETERTPWVPFVGCHAAKLIGVTCEEYFQNADYIVDGVTRAVELYRPDGIPALFDLQVEAEAMGCKLVWADGNPPSVGSHPLEDGAALADIPVPDENSGRWPLILDATRRICQTVGKEKAVYGLITGPFTLALHLMGTDIFYNMIDEPEEVMELMAFCTKVAVKSAQMYMDAGVDVVAAVDPMTSQISPDMFEEFVAPSLIELFDYIHGQGKPGTLFVCGNAKANIEAMCQCHADGLSIDENIPLDYVRDICQQNNMSFGGNIKLTLTMLFGSVSDNINDALTCIQTGGRKGFILSPGCDMPYDVPEKNAEAVAAVVHGEVAELMESENVLSGVEIELPDYDDPNHVYLDVITLDSAACAACQYTMEAIYRSAAEFGEKLVVAEHKIKEKESVVFMLKLGVSNVPTLCIDGQIKFVSLIPDDEVLKAAYREALQKKGL